MHALALSISRTSPVHRAAVLGFAFLGAMLLLGCTTDQAADVEPTPTSAPQQFVADTAEDEAPTPEPTDTPVPSLEIAYIGGTGGDGVGLRDACRADARIDGAWAEGTAVRIVGPGEDGCEGWTYVVGPGIGSWVLDDYLTDTAPPAEAPSGGSTTTTSTPPGTSTQTPSVAAQQMFVWGVGNQNDFVVVFAGNTACDSALVPTAGGLWGLVVGPGSMCSPSPGAPLSFSLNGQGAASSVPLSYAPGGNVQVTLVP